MSEICKYCVGFLLFCVAMQAKEYVIDMTHSSVSFGVKHLSVADTIGNFQDFSGKLDIENGKIKDLQGKVIISSITTFNSARDEELLTKDFFYTKEANLKSLSFKNGILRTKLTINNISREVDFRAKITGPIRNPSLDLKKKSANPLLSQPTHMPFKSAHLDIKDDNGDCGCYVSYGDNVVGVELIGSINRFDFNIATTTPNELLGQNVSIKIILEASN